MLVTKTIKILINKRNLRYYVKLNSDIKVGDTIDIDVKDLSKGSHIFVDVDCDKCGEHKRMMYKTYKYLLDENGLYFCIKCSASIRTKETCIKKYGVDNVYKVDWIKQKQKNKVMEKYGCEYYSQTDEYKEKFKKTCLERYDCEHHLQNIEILNKRNKTNLDKYGVEHSSLNPVVRNKQTITRIKNIVKNIGYEFIDYDFNEHKIKMKCSEGHISDVKATLIYHRKNYNVIICPICNPVGVQHSAREKELLKFIEDNYNGEILENNKSVINPYELDMYLPDLKLAIEFNGVFWHTIKFKPENYHYDKFDLCKEKGIKLINIWEDDWINKKDAVKTLILNSIQNNKIYGQIKKVGIKETSEYLKKNHLLGNIKSDIRIGQYDNNELISLITLNKNDDHYNLLREININDELLSFFIINYNPKQINYLINRSYANKNIESIGFNIEKTTESNTFKVVKKIKIKSNAKIDIYDEGNYLYCINF